MSECLRFLHTDIDIVDFQQNVLDISNHTEKTVSSDISIQNENSVSSDEDIVRNFEEFAPVVDQSSFSSPTLSFEYDFIEVAVRRGIGRNCLNAFLSVFHKHKIGNFPRDARACVGALRKVDSVPMCRGRYFNFGLFPSLCIVLKNASLKGISLSIQINIDGLPVGNSSSVVFWPILCRALVGDFVSTVFIVGLYCGTAKPKNVSEFLKPFLDEVKEGYANGFRYTALFVMLLHANMLR